MVINNKSKRNIFNMKIRRGKVYYIKSAENRPWRPKIEKVALWKMPSETDGAYCFVSSFGDSHKDYDFPQKYFNPKDLTLVLSNPKKSRKRRRSFSESIKKLFEDSCRRVTIPARQIFDIMRTH